MEMNKEEAYNIIRNCNEKEAYNVIKRGVEAINTRPYATLAEYEKVECIKVLLKAYEKQQEIIEGVVHLIYYTNEYPENIYCMVEDLLKEHGIERKYYDDNI